MISLFLSPHLLIKCFTSTSYLNQRSSSCYRGSGNYDCRVARRRHSLLCPWRFVSELHNLVKRYLPGTLDFFVFWSCFLFPCSCWVSRTNELIWTFVAPVLVVCLVRFLHNSFPPFYLELLILICFFVSLLGLFHSFPFSLGIMDMWECLAYQFVSL